VAQLVGGALVGWFPDGQRVLVNGSESLEAEPFLGAVNVADGAFTGIVRNAEIRGGLISPEGGWIAYQVAFSGDPARDGLWVVRADASEIRKLPLFGAYRWRAEGQLLIVPLEPGAASHRVVQADAATGNVINLTDPKQLTFRIAGGDWSLSPDGHRLAFVNAADRNIWVIELP
jgi:dipeptidyl aminopeptidase/acylaminoacyl peptidase